MDSADKIRPPTGEEDEEDVWIREGEALMARMSPEERAEVESITDGMIERMQRPENAEWVDKVFRREHR